MCVPLDKVEFFSYEHEIWYRLSDGSTHQLCESDYGMISVIHQLIEEFYPSAFKALCHEYRACLQNVLYSRFRIVARFIRCNFSALDNVPDMINGMFSTFEYVPCPLRGECRYERVICHPEFNHKLSDAEKRVMALWYSGSSEDTIASHLCISRHTVHNHVRNSYLKLGVHSRAEFVRIADINGFFNVEQS